MKVKWLGHASMLVTSDDGLRVVTDPYTPGAFGLNYAPIDVEADVVTVSHDHADHNNVPAVKGKPDVVKGGGVHNIRGVAFQGIDCYHDDSSGSQRGTNTTFCFSLDGIRVCHLGDLGHPLRPEDRAQIDYADVLFMPVGGNFTIDASVAAETGRVLSAKVVIPMHYCNKRCPDFPVAGVEEFLTLMANVRRADGTEVEFHKDSLPDTTEVVVLEPALYRLQHLSPNRPSERGRYLDQLEYGNADWWCRYGARYALRVIRKTLYAEPFTFKDAVSPLMGWRVLQEMPEVMTTQFGQ